MKSLLGVREPALSDEHYVVGSPAIKPKFEFNFAWLISPVPMPRPSGAPSPINKKSGLSAALLQSAMDRELLAGGFARRGLGLLLGLKILAGDLIDGLHRQPRLAA